MERIGFAASKIAKGNLFLYNCYVLVITSLITMLLFFLSGSAIFLGLWVIRITIGPFMPSVSPGLWNLIFCYSLVALTGVITFVSLAAIFKNIRLRK